MKIAPILNQVAWMFTGFLTVGNVAAANSIIVTVAEKPSQQVSSLTGTSIYDFNALSTGYHSSVSWNQVGTYDQLYILNADQYGGATDASHPNGSKYSVQGVGTSVGATTLSLNQSSGYFGLSWSAGDASNVLEFYNNNKLLAQFTTSNLLNQLGSEYYGNPRNRLLDSHEPFAFINFFGDKNTTWNKIVLRNKSNSGFESDNYTSRVSTYNSKVDAPTVLGTPIVRVSGTTATKITQGAVGASYWGSESAIPGAPAPSLAVLGVFGLGLAAKEFHRRSKTVV